MMFPFASVVERFVSETFSTRASISGLPSSSTRRKRMPELQAAGRTVMLTRLPLCNPALEKVAGRLSVCCCSTRGLDQIANALGKRGGRRKYPRTQIPNTQKLIRRLGQFLGIWVFGSLGEAVFALGSFSFASTT